ncbi:hypothetical protein LMH87_011472 [Akanthomyces muscarius]|uniref:Uncharacterized protein n=1 Tax=Akanthomyces muscarius TaxID=2231603 RepID=A0A9W8QBC6_AKAMU|nr:hypothetical protein LMH87_011472 [Akanthomyces muscarius]KAJ4150737.1 hypothetical protein LMH87_011472 [Akanthomyces muscarius]
MVSPTSSPSSSATTVVPARCDPCHTAQDPQLEVRTPEPFAAISTSASQRSAGCVTCRERSIERGEIPSFCDCTITRLEYEDYKRDGSRSASSSRALGQSFSGTKTRLEAGVCGTAIQFRANGKQSNATLGGIVKLVYKNGSFDLKGLTVAHAAVACLDDESLGVSALSISSCEDKDDDNDSSMDEDWDSYNKNSEDAHMLDLGNERSTHKSRKQHDPWVFENPHTIGEACLAQSMLSTLKGEPTENGSFFDWALTPLSVAKMNQLADTAYQQGSRLIRKIRQFALHATWFSSEPVVIMCGSSVKRGRLLPEPSRILISPGLGFVTAYMIELSGQGILSDGDSGSWVISEDTQDLLGHIVATDVLGTGYFIPAEDIFNDIVRNRLAVAVTLPTVHDFRLKKNEAQGGINAMETKGRHSGSSEGKQATVLPYLDGPELSYRDDLKFPYLDDIESLNSFRGMVTWNVAAHQHQH